MPDRTPCTHCAAVGYVRREHVIERGRAITQFYCGRCDRTWSVADDADARRRSSQRKTRRPAAADRSKRSRT